MEKQKKCPQCGVNFEGRANKIYCSDKCKMAAFQSQQQHKETEAETQEVPTVLGSQGFTKSKTTFQTPLEKVENPAEILKLQIELRKLELEYQKELAVLASEEKQRERDFELKKMQLTFEQEKKELQQEIDNLQEQQLQLTHEAEPSNWETEVEHETEDEEYDEETEEEITLPTALQKRYRMFIQRYLALHGTKIPQERTQKALNVAQEIQAEIAEFAEEYEVEPSDFREFQLLKGVAANLETVIQTLNNRAFFQAKTFDFKLSKEWYEVLKESGEG